jgi:ubiquinone/menaquinone biosynthesis C-methylase UbiE
VLARVGAQGSLVGLDPTPEMLGRAGERVAREGWANVELVEGDAADLPFDDESFDAVCSMLSWGVVSPTLASQVSASRPGRQRFD